MIHRDTANDLLDLKLGSGTPTNVYLALVSIEPKFGDGPSDLIEPTAADYERLEIANNATSFPAASNGVKTNGVLLAFPAAIAAWKAIRGWVLVDHTGDGQLLFSRRMSQQFVGEGAEVTFPSGSLNIRMR